MPPKKKKTDAFKKLDIYKLDYSKLLKYTESLQKKLEAESLQRSMAETEVDRLKAILVHIENELVELSSESLGQVRKYELLIGEREKVLRQEFVSLMCKNKRAVDELRREKDAAVENLAEKANKRFVIKYKQK